MIVDGITVQVTRKRIRRIWIRVVDGEVRLSVPHRTPDSLVRSLVHERAAWIRQALASERRRVPPSELPLAEQKAALRARALPMFDHWGAVLGRRMQRLELREMTSRWGSCTPSTGRISLNLALGRLPDELVEYVVVHELVHLWESGHGAGFVARMDDCLPDWRERRRRLHAVRP